MALSFSLAAEKFVPRKDEEDLLTSEISSSITVAVGLSRTISLSSFGSFDSNFAVRLLVSTGRWTSFKIRSFSPLS